MLPPPHAQSKPAFLELVLLEQNQGAKMMWMMDDDMDVFLMWNV